MQQTVKLLWVWILFQSTVHCVCVINHSFTQFLFAEAPALDARPKWILFVTQLSFLTAIIVTDPADCRAHSDKWTQVFDISGNTSKRMMSKTKPFPLTWSRLNFNFYFHRLRPPVSFSCPCATSLHQTVLPPHNFSQINVEILTSDWLGRDRSLGRWGVEEEWDWAKLLQLNSRVWGVEPTGFLLHMTISSLNGLNYTLFLLKHLNQQTDRLEDTNAPLE